MTKISTDALKRVGSGLKRAECVLCLSDGGLLMSHLGKGVTYIAPSGAQRTIGDIAEIEGQAWMPNGLALQPDGTILVANMGEGGGLWRLGADGNASAVLRTVDGQGMSTTNFVLIDRAGRTWITVTTRQFPIFKAFFPRGGPERADGYIAVIDAKGARIVADNLAFANEIRIDENAQKLYVAETFGRRITRFNIGSDAGLTGREVFTEFGEGTFPDGIAFDAEGSLWATSLISNRVIRIAPDGSQEIMLDDSDAAHITHIEAALKTGKMGKDDFLKATSDKMENVSSIAFGGPDLRTAYLGSLTSPSLLSFHSSVAGAPMTHWGMTPKFLD